MAENEKKTEKTSVLKKIGAWFRSIKSECKKISWANWKSVRSNSIIVIVCVLIFSAVIALLDLTFNGAIEGLANIF